MAKNTAQKNEEGTLKAGLKTGTEKGSLPANKKAVNAKASLSTGSKVSKGTATKKAATKKAAAKAAPKAKKEAAEGGRKGRAPAWPLETKVKVLVSENPKREGSASYDRFALYGKGTTVGAFLEAGGTSADLHWDSEHEYISIG